MTGAGNVLSFFYRERRRTPRKLASVEKMRLVELTLSELGVEAES